MKILSRAKLERDSEICVNELCTLDLNRIHLDQLLTTLTEVELQEVAAKLLRHVGL